MAGVERTVEETLELNAAPERVWALLTSFDLMTLFTGFGPIPGIARVEWLTEGGYRLDARRRVTNTDGSTHLEDIASFEPGRLLVDRIHGFDSPMRFLARQAHDRFELQASGSGTRLVRRFTVELLSPLVAPVGLLLQPMLRVAVRRHHAGLRRALDRGAMA
jgi:uncharacterized protein YndB with AHSA1/START domain